MGTPELAKTQSLDSRSREGKWRDRRASRAWGLPLFLEGGGRVGGSSQCPGMGGAPGRHVRTALGRWVAGGWQAARRGQGLSTHERPQQTSRWRENNVNQVSLCWRRKVQICTGRRPGRRWTGIRGTAVNSRLSIEVMRCRDTHGRMCDARVYTHACVSHLCPRRGPESSDTQGPYGSRQCPGLRL